MRVEQLGEGDPSVAVVGGIHGDEPCGVYAIEQLLANPPAVNAPVKLIIANEEASAAKQRYVDEDLNRAFPGSLEGATHESRLAAALSDELQDCYTLALHSTQSYPNPFAIIAGQTDYTDRVLRALPIDAVVDTGPNVQGRLFATSGVIEVECGLQGTQQARENAIQVTRAFLVAMGVIDDSPAVSEEPVPVFELGEEIPKPPGEHYEVFVKNFEQVAAGERFAAVDGDPLIAEEPFYPILLSPNGYQTIFGYRGQRAGTAPQARDLG